MTQTLSDDLASEHWQVVQTTTFHPEAGGRLLASFAAAKAMAEGQGLKLSDCYLCLNDVLLPLDEEKPERRYDMRCNWRYRALCAEEKASQ